MNYEKLALLCLMRVLAREGIFSDFGVTNSQCILNIWLFIAKGASIWFASMKRGSIYRLTKPRAMIELFFIKCVVILFNFGEC